MVHLREAHWDFISLTGAEGASPFPCLSWNSWETESCRLDALWQSTQLEMEAPASPLRPKPTGWGCRRVRSWAVGRRTETSRDVKTTVLCCTTGQLFSLFLFISLGRGELQTELLSRVSRLCYLLILPYFTDWKEIWFLSSRVLWFPFLLHCAPRSLGHLGVFPISGKGSQHLQLLMSPVLATGFSRTPLPRSGRIFFSCFWKCFLHSWFSETLPIMNFIITRNDEYC